MQVHMLFKFLGVLLAIYTAYAAYRGEVYARSRWWGKTIERDAQPTYFWVVIVIYFGLSVALLTVF
jgi:hypothetical protein